MKKYWQFTLLTLLVMTGYARADAATWLEDGDTVHATAPNANLSAKGAEKPTNQITLSTGQIATLTGGVYVNATDASPVLAWAVSNGYIAFQDQYIANAIHVETTVEKSIEVAGLIGKIEGVTTAMPNYRVPVVPK